VIDEYTQEYLTLPVGRRRRNDDVLAALTDLFGTYGPPDHIRSDQDSKFVANVVKDWFRRISGERSSSRKPVPGRMAKTNPSTASSGTSC